MKRRSRSFETRTSCIVADADGEMFRRVDSIGTVQSHRSGAGTSADRATLQYTRRFVVSSSSGTALSRSILHECSRHAARTYHNNGVAASPSTKVTSSFDPDFSSPRRTLTEPKAILSSLRARSLIWTSNMPAARSACVSGNATSAKCGSRPSSQVICKTPALVVVACAVCPCGSEGARTRVTARSRRAVDAMNPART